MRAIRDTLWLMAIPAWFAIVATPTAAILATIVTAVIVTAAMAVPNTRTLHRGEEE
jgi:hypothetical protein